MTNAPKRGWTEELEITASELVDRVKELIAEGNVRRLITVSYTHLTLPTKRIV